MTFLTDQQTIDDLGIFARSGADSVYGIFNRTVTRQAAGLLEDMFRHPLADGRAIQQRSAIFKYFFTQGTIFPFRSELFDTAAAYLSVTDERTRLSHDVQTLGSRMASLVADNNDYKNISKGLMTLLEIFQVLQKFLLDLGAGVSVDDPYAEERSQLLALLAEPEIQTFLAEDKKSKFSYNKAAAYDGILRFRQRSTVLRLLQYVYRLDLYISVAGVAKDRKFTFATISPQQQPGLSLAGVYHPHVKNAVPNSLLITPQQHVLFLTGANMAGKSTFMKSVGIALFLAHMGFPVPAQQVVFTVMDGIYTTINLPDNLGMGASHFYAEVLRVKKVSAALGQGRRLFVIFDELFRGTNVRDAYEATTALTAAFAERSDSFFVISTHIVEAGEVLQKDKRIRPLFLPTRMAGNKPVYTYTLEEGLTADRHGMVIINNEGIPALLKAKSGNQGSQEAAKDRRPQLQEEDTRFADQQTLDDLNLTGKYRPGSCYGLFNRIETAGAERLLEEMFLHPLTNETAIHRRVTRLKFLQEKRLVFPFSRKQMSRVEDYLHAGAGNHLVSTTIGLLRLKMQQVLTKDERYNAIVSGVASMIGFIHDCRTFFRQVQAAAGPWEPEVEEALSVLDDPRLGDMPLGQPADRWGWLELASLHYLFGNTMRSEISTLCAILYDLDVGIAVANVARERGFAWAEAKSNEENCLSIEDLRHPVLEKAVGNDLDLRDDSNLIFLTGANMAGKSTLMKAFGIALYLAHMGFPVAARKMTFSVKEGLYSSINVSDNLSLGYSHFYAEVLRVKKVAEAVSKGRRLAVIFDELFKGTNVKDAFDATLSVTAAFAGYTNCWFVISTHITEVGQSLGQKAGNVQFAYLPTVMKGSKPTYPYSIREGITDDRHGMLIIENEGILELIKN